MRLHDLLQESHVKYTKSMCFLKSVLPVPKLQMDLSGFFDFAFRPLQSQTLQFWFRIQIPQSLHLLKYKNREQELVGLTCRDALRPRMGFVTCSVTFLLQELRFPSYSTGRYFCCSGMRGAAEGIRVGSQRSLLALALPSSWAVLSFSRSHDVSRQQCSGETLPVRVLRPIIYEGL